MSYESLKGICENVKENGWSLDNLAFGSGGGLLQKVHRDTQKCAFKCCYAYINGKDVCSLLDMHACALRSHYNISHCTGFHSVALSFPSQSPGIPGHIPLYWVSLSRIVLPIPKSRDTWTYPTVLGLSQSHCPSHPKVLGYPDTYPTVLGVSQLHCPSHPKVPGYLDISHCIGSLSVALSFPSQIHAILISSVSRDCGMGRTVGPSET